MYEELTKVLEAFAELCNSTSDLYEQLAKKINYAWDELVELTERAQESLSEKPKLPRPIKSLFNKGYKAPTNKPSITARSRLNKRRTK